MPVAIGADIGQVNDPTALCVVELGATAFHLSGLQKPPTIQVTHLERLPLGTPYPQVKTRIAELADRLYFLDPEICIDAGGPGKPIIDELRAPNILERVHAITATGGTNETLQRRFGTHEDWTVGKGALIHHLASFVFSGRLHVSAELPEFDQFAKELGSITHHFSSTGRDRFEVEGGEGHHADLVFAVAISSWRLMRPRPVIRSGRIDTLSR